MISPRPSMVFIHLLILLSVCAGGMAQTSANVEIPKLEFGQTIERELTGGKKHLYKIRLEAGQFLRVEAEQSKCDVIFTLISTEKLNFFDVNNASTDGLEFAEAAVETAGEYVLEVVSMSSQNGSYKLKIAELRTALPTEINQTIGIVLINRAFLQTTSSSTAESIRQGIANFEIALEKFRLARARSFEARVLSSTGTSYNRLGDTKKAVEYFEKGLAIATEIDDKYEMSLILSNLGSVLYLRGEWQRAFDALVRSLELRREIKNLRGEAISLIKVGTFLQNSGDFEGAIKYFEEALTVIAERDLPINYEADALENLGTTYLTLNELEKSRTAFERALEISRETKSRRREGIFLNNLAKVFGASGELEKALQTNDEAQKIAVALDDKPLLAAVLKNRGQLETKNREPEKAVISLQKAAEIFRSVEDVKNLADTLLGFAKAEQLRGNFEAAQKKAEEAIALIEKIRGRLQNLELRDSFSTNLQKYYSYYIELLMARHLREPDKGFAALALEAGERARVRGLLNLLTESNIDIRQGVDLKLLETESELRNLLSARLENLTRILSGRNDKEKTAQLKSEIEQISSEYEQVRARIRASSPRYAALTEPKTLGLTEIQNDLLDKDSVLLEFALGETKSYLWIVTKNSFQTVELPAGAVIEATAKKMYEALTARNKEVKFETAGEKIARLKSADADFVKYSTILSKMIIEPAASYIGGKRLLIVADGALQYVPFQTVFSAGQKQYLVETNEVVNLPSASALSVLRKQFEDRPKALKTLAVFADPVFQRTDTRFGGNVKPSKNTFVGQSQMRGGFDTRDGFELMRLPFTRREADLISSLVPTDKVAKRLDFKANRETVLSAELTDYRFIHFATHGFINAQNPELSSLVLSLFDEKGREQDGFLRIGDVYNLKLNAEMVVLSGCRTGLGREIKGEGLVGLTRGFMYAGARRVAVSLWDVNDEATSELMGRFYREMLADKKIAPAAALRRTQLSMLRDKRWKNPYFWGAFILQGEPNGF